MLKIGISPHLLSCPGTAERCRRLNSVAIGELLTRRAEKPLVLLGDRADARGRPCGSKPSGLRKLTVRVLQANPPLQPRCCGPAVAAQPTATAPLAAPPTRRGPPRPSAGPQPEAREGRPGAPRAMGDRDMQACRSSERDLGLRCMGHESSAGGQRGALRLGSSPGLKHNARRERRARKRLPGLRPTSLRDPHHLRAAGLQLACSARAQARAPVDAHALD